MAQAVARLAVMAALLFLSTPTHAENGRILFVRKDKVMEQRMGSLEAPRQVAVLPEGFNPLGIQVSRNGKLIVLDGGNQAAWIVDGEVKLGRCTGKANPSPSGECLACPVGKHFQLVSAVHEASLELPAAYRDVGFLGEGKGLYAVTDDGVVAFEAKAPEETRVLSKGPARKHVMISPDGGRAVSVIGERETSRVQVSALDGEGVPRMLGGPAMPVAWSPDSQWVLLLEGSVADRTIESGDDTDDTEDEPEVEETPGETPESEPGDDRLEEAPEGRGEAGSPWLMAATHRRPGRPVHRTKGRKRAPPPPAPLPTVRACATRALGGESKCWNEFAPLGFSPDSELVLLRKGTTLYAGRIAGVRPELPKIILDGIEGPVAWVP
ncbi:MAG: hypothetical protein HY698_15230 [Deltaproteobacteria bacterium]|nr:hypothetical protein [Deltaproteobacteria bacterium]